MVTYGVLQQHVGCEQAGSWGRVGERWRFKYEDAVAARAHALRDPTNIDCATLIFHEGAIPELPDAGFPGIERELLAEADWSLVFKGRWVKSENTLLTEGRALLWGVKHKLRSCSAFGRRHVFLVDNLPLALAAAKGRAGSPILAPILRSLCAHSFASGSRFSVRWLPSEYNPADRPSRRGDGHPVPQPEPEEARPHCTRQPDCIASHQAQALRLNEHAHFESSSVLQRDSGPEEPSSDVPLLGGFITPLQIAAVSAATAIQYVETFLEFACWVEATHPQALTGPEPPDLKRLCWRSTTSSTSSGRVRDRRREASSSPPSCTFTWSGVRSSRRRSRDRPEVCDAGITFGLLSLDSPCPSSRSWRSSRTSSTPTDDWTSPSACCSGSRAT